MSKLIQGNILREIIPHRMVLPFVTLVQQINDCNMKNSNSPILMTEEYWANSMLSVVRHAGSILLDGGIYTICDKRGHTIFECSAEAEKKGRENAIEPGEPCDLVRSDFIPLYKKLGRDRFIEIMKENPLADDNQLKRIMEGVKQ